VWETFFVGAVERYTMSEECIFCSIVDGEIPSHTVYEDDQTVAFLDANPLARGHTVVIPREHHERIEELPRKTAESLFATIHDLVPIIEDAVGADASNVGFNDGEAAGQMVPHVHGHIVPRFEGDDGRNFHAVAASQKDLSEEELAQIAADVRAADG
jgi:histidine triad (HIT) family protein